ncbi:MAG: glycosyltransferase, partial [Planctomycetota bacterium]
SLVDVLLLTSHMEANPVSILEAMACEKPVVATRVGSVPETVLDGETGFLVAPGDARGLADRVIELFRNPERAARMGREARERVLARGSVRRMVEGYENLLREIYAAKCGCQVRRQPASERNEQPGPTAIRHSSSSVTDQLQTIGNRLLLAVGRNPWKNRSPEDLTVGDLMRKNVKGVPQEATFDEVVAAIEHSHDNTYPVVGRAGELVGVIRYRELSGALFDPALSPLVRAADVTTTARRVLHPDEPVARVHEIFEATKDDCLPVVTREEPSRLVGVIRRRDVLRLLIRGQIDSQEGSK